MANKSEIRLQIVTALDAAGIKATKQQIDAMTSSVMDSNRKMGKSANETAAAFGRMHGPVGKLTGAFGNLGGAMGKVVGTAGMIAGAFETGWAVGTKLWEGIEHIRKEWLHVKTATEEVIEANRRLEKQRKADAAAWDASFKSMKEMRAMEEERAKLSIDNIKAEAEAYRAAARAKFTYLSAGMDAQEQRLERERFEDILTLQANGYDESAIKQVEAIYDVLKAELDISRKIEAVRAKEREELIKQKELRDKLAEASDKETRAIFWNSDVRKKVEDLENWEFADADRVTTKERDRRLAAARKELAASEIAVERAGDEWQAIKGKLDATGKLSETQALRRATVLDEAYLARDRAAAAYDQATANGDALGLQFGEGYIQYLRQSTEQSYRALLEIQKNTADYDEALNKLLTMRGGE